MMPGCFVSADMFFYKEEILFEALDTQKAATAKMELDPNRRMCTRFYIDSSPELRPYAEAANASPLMPEMVSKLGKDFRTSGEIRPTDMAAVIATGAKGNRTAFPMVWGYHIKGIDRPVVNARVESAKDKASFAADWLRHRCIVPASCYFEWEHLRRPDGRMKTGDKYAIHPKGSDVTYLAGLYRIEEERGFYYPVFTILTQKPGAELSKIHNRMPVILPKEMIGDWITPDADPEKIVQNALTDMIMEKAI